MNNKYKYTPDVFLVSAMDMNTAHIATIPNINATTCCPGPNAYVIAGWNNSRTDPEIIALMQVIELLIRQLLEVYILQRNGFHMLLLMVLLVNK